MSLECGLLWRMQLCSYRFGWSKTRSRDSAPGLEESTGNQQRQPGFRSSVSPQTQGANLKHFQAASRTPPKKKPANSAALSSGLINEERPFAPRRKDTQEKDGARSQLAGPLSFPWSHLQVREAHNSWPGPLPSLLEGRDTILIGGGKDASISGSITESPGS
ncbi:hypothetical protein COCON_G00158580 [Conger conger]|uniref:Uncharacterized protein n=1 Tax=Conger conger TaxID=82655 RepID=A0A9Q1D9P6_CONCO|nr:hypothetical protein COCON_G00158580 [Conger conger]